jgi:phage tail-like protein
MVSGLTSKSVSLQISPMQISATTSPRGSRMLGSEAVEGSQPQSEIVVYPGELCRVALEIKNWESQPQQFTLKLEGTFPLEWCQVQTDVKSAPQFGTAPEPNSVVQTSGAARKAQSDRVTLEVAAKKSKHADLWFLVPNHFFEGQDVFEGSKEKQIDFRGCLSIYANQNPSQGSSSEPLQESNFELNIRPRSNYTAFLPIVYQEVDYIQRFIKIFEQAFEPVVNSYISMWAHLDPLTAPQALLPFLAHWVDWSIDGQLDLTHQRRLIRRAVEIYRCRGTRKGLRFYLHLYTGLPLDEHIDREEDKSISITEPFSQGCLFGLAYVGEDAIIGGGKAYHFDVRLRTQPDSSIDEQLVRRIIEQEKPAFCSYSLRIETNHCRAFT